MQQTIAYTYGDSNWKDKLTAYNGTTISYDAIGNPTSDGTWTYTWTNGRQLASMSKSGTSASYTYNEDGLRVQKNVNGTVTNYVLHGKNVVHLTQGSNNLHFFYGADGSPAIVEFNGVSYGYVKNLQGDVIAIVNASGAAVVQYAYDAWGKPISKTGSMASTLGTLNPFRYRGYVYDEETGLYYLRSRYYNPSWGRFVNADALIDQSQILAPNSFAYCSNQAINQIDSSGHTAVYIDLDDDFDHDGPFSFGFGIGGYQVDLSVAARSSVWTAPLHQGMWSSHFVFTKQIYADENVKSYTIPNDQPLVSDVSISFPLDTNRINHIMLPKHAWDKTGATTWEEVQQIIRYTVINGTSAPYKNDNILYSTKYGNETIDVNTRIVYESLTVVDAWVRTR